MCKLNSVCFIHLVQVNHSNIVVHQRLSLCHYLGLSCCWTIQPHPSKEANRAFILQSFLVLSYLRGVKCLKWFCNYILQVCATWISYSASGFFLTSHCSNSKDFICGECLQYGVLGMQEHSESGNYNQKTPRYRFTP